jgi:hypothetical protein
MCILVNKESSQKVLLGGTMVCGDGGNRRVLVVVELKNIECYVEN